MLRLFGYAGAIQLLTLALALATGSVGFRLLALLTGLFIVSMFLFLQRSQPRRHGTAMLAGLREPVTVRRDEHGEPHITARSWHDLFLAQGYVTAQDRLWQMEIARRTAAGRLAEVRGEALLERDRFLRTLGLHRLARQSLELCPAEVRSWLEAYAEGVNAFIAEGRLPPEFTCARLKPEPWSAADSVAIVKLLAYEFAPPLTDSLLRIQVAQVAGAELATALFGDEGDPSVMAALAAADLPDLTDLWTVAACSPQTASGATAWAVAGSRSLSGRPIAGCALETAPRAPSPVHPVSLAGPDAVQLSGAAIAGVPGVFVGQSRHGAWGFAPAESAAPELVLEPPLAGGDAPECLVEPIRVRGRQEPVDHAVLIGRAGPVLATSGDGVLTLRSPVLRPGTEIAALLGINQARSYGEFRTALAGWSAPGLVAVFAGADGTIARVATGENPRGEVNPPEGILLGEESSYGAQRLRGHLASRQDWSRERLEPILSDTVNLQARGLLQPLLQAIQEGLRQGHHPESLSDLEKRALLLLSDWDLNEAASSAAACLWQRWYHFLLEAVFRPQMGLTLFNQFSTARSAVPLADRLFLRTLAGEPNPWLALEGEQGLPRLALRSFRRAVALLAAKQGPNPEGWAWGREHRVRFRQGLGQACPLLGSLVDLGPYPLGGSPSTLNRSALDPTASYPVATATTYRRLVDLGLPGERVAIVAPGAGGHPLSPDFASQLPLWLLGEHRPSRQDPGRQEQVLTLQPIA